jgi:hypothetical protein
VVSLSCSWSAPVRFAAPWLRRRARFEIVEHGVTIAAGAVSEIVPGDPWTIHAEGFGEALAYQPAVPPETLFHGTVAAALPAIRAQGLQRMARHHVHLAADAATARAVGMRRGKPIVLVIAAGRMHREGHVFFLSANGVWLAEAVPPGYLAPEDG